MAASANNPFASSPTLSSNLMMQNFAQHIQANGATNLPAGTLKFLQGLPSSTQPSPWAQPNANTAPSSLNPFQNAVGSGQNHWQPGTQQTPTQHDWWCASCGLLHNNPSSTKCRSCRFPRDQQQAMAATQRKGKGRGQGTKGKGKGKQQSTNYSPQDQLWTLNGKLIWDPAGWFAVARKTDSTNKLILYDQHRNEVDVE